MVTPIAMAGSSTFPNSITIKVYLHYIAPVGLSVEHHFGYTQQNDTHTEALRQAHRGSAVILKLTGCGLAIATLTHYFTICSTPGNRAS